MKRFARKSISVLLSLLMVLSVCTGLVFTASASDNTKPDSMICDDLTFIVPEVIYLTPDGRSWNMETQSSFQYYVNNNSDGSVERNAAQKTGRIYFQLPGVSTATIAYQFYNYNLSSTLSGGVVSLSNNGTISSGGSVTINSGTAPVLGASSTGCYLR